MNITNIVKFNDGYTFELDEDFTLTYEKHGDLLIGSDETQTFFNVLYYSPCGGNPIFDSNYAFGGRKFDLLMKDGTSTHCYGQYWDGKYPDAEKILDIKFANFTHSTLSSLKKCFIFYSGAVDSVKLQAMLDEFSATHLGYVPWGYQEYKKYLQREEVTQ